MIIFQYFRYSIENYFFEACVKAISNIIVVEKNKHLFFVNNFHIIKSIEYNLTFIGDKNNVAGWRNSNDDK